MRKLGLIFAIFSVAATAGFAGASTTVTLDEYPYGVTNGQYYVGPADLTINGRLYLGICYDARDLASIGESWNAGVYGMADLSSGAYFTKAPVDKYTKAYEQVSFLSTLFSPGNESQRADI